MSNLDYEVVGMDNGKEKRRFPDGSIMLVTPSAPASATEASEELREQLASVTAEKAQLEADLKDANEAGEAKDKEIKDLTATVEKQAAEITALKNQLAAKPDDKKK